MEGTALAALIGLVVPLIVAIVANVNTSSAVRGSIAALVSIVVGAVVVFFTGNAAVEQYAAGILAVILAAQSSYGMFWKPLGVSSWILEHLGNTTRTTSY